VEEAENKRMLADNLMLTLKTGTTDEISNKFIDISEKLSDFKLNELRARRDADESKEEREYLQRLHNQDVETIRRMEGNIASYESIMAQKEEEWRKKDDERQKLLLNPKRGLIESGSMDKALS
jgi:hypothetical protein